MADEYRPQAHPYLHEPRIYISDVPAWVEDGHLAVALQHCSPFRPNIVRDGSVAHVSGTIDFRFLDKAEKALATLHGRPIPDLVPTVILNLSPFPATDPPTPLPPPAAQPRIVKHLPPGYQDAMIYDIFRPYGALANIRMGIIGPDSALVEFWREEDARAASEALHCADVEGANIAIQLYQPRRAPAMPGTELHATAPSFVPGGGGFSYPSPQYSPSPPRGSPYARSTPLFLPGPGQQVQPAAPGTSHSGLIDPCNLFCKNLDADIDSNAMFSHFRRFGQIVSARVMRNENGESRGFGFVSYQTPEQANAAMAAMNGVTLGSKPIVVRLHEPKQFRQEKLAQRFQGNGHPRSASGATSPTPSEGGESMYGGYNSPRHISSPLASPGNGHFQERPARRASGSYYQAALNGNLNVPLTYDALNALSANVRREVLSGELSRRVRALETVPNGEVDVIVDSLINLSLGEVVQSLSDNGHLAEHVGATLRALHGTPEEHEHEQSPAADGSSLAPGTVTAPEHPSTPVSLNTSSATPPRTASPAGSLPVQAPERDRMAAAVARWAPGPQEAELTELLMGLPKRDRALCLFNENKLREKIAEARVILDADDDEDPPPSASATSTVPVTPATPVAKAVQPQQPAPATPELSRAPSAAASPMPATPSSPADAEGGDTLTLESLARLSAAEIVRNINSGGASGVSLPKADPAVVSQTDAFVDGLSEKPIQQQKQALGDKLFRVVKAFGVKGAPKLTIALLDSEDLRSLAHLMNSYPSVLKEKVLIVQASR